MDLRSVPPLSPFNYAQQKLKMVPYLKSHDLLDVSFGASKESYEEENDWLTECDRAYGSMGILRSPDMHCLMESVECPFDLQRNIDKTFGVQKEVDNT